MNAAPDSPCCSAPILGGYVCSVCGDALAGYPRPESPQRVSRLLESSCCHEPVIVVHGQDTCSSCMKWCEVEEIRAASEESTPSDCHHDDFRTREAAQ